MLVKMLRDWRCYLRGDIADLGGGICIELIRRGICEEVAETTSTEGAVNVETVEVAAMEPHVETQVKRKRGRPRKYPERYADGN